MTTISNYKLRVTMAVLLAMPAAAGEWRDLAKLRPGDKVGVVQVDRKRVEGRWVSLREGALEVDGTVIREENVLRVYRVGGGKAKRRLIGLAVGVAAGTAIAVGVARGTNGEGTFAGPAAGAAVAGGAGIGLALGSLGGGGNVTVYEKGK